VDSRVEQTLSSGVLIRQDIRTSIRFVMFETEYPEWQYATDGGTLFLVNYRNRIFGITCLHVFKTFNVKNLIATARKMALKGAKVAGITGLLKLGTPSGEAVESDILDICLVEFAREWTRHSASIWALLSYLTHRLVSLLPPFGRSPGATT
jgi:hypothetical protein